MFSPTTLPTGSEEAVALVGGLMQGRRTTLDEKVELDGRLKETLQTSGSASQALGHWTSETDLLKVR